MGRVGIDRTISGRARGVRCRSARRGAGLHLSARRRRAVPSLAARLSRHVCAGCGGQRYAVRVYRALKTAPEIAYELELLVHLASRGVSVAGPVVDRPGRLSVPVEAPEGIRHAAVFTFVDGRSLFGIRRRAGALSREESHLSAPALTRAPGPEEGKQDAVTFRESTVSRSQDMAIAYSILSADALMKKVADAYAIDPPTACHLVRRRRHDTYRLVTRAARYIVRIYRTGSRSVDEVAYELDLVNHLAAKGVGVAVPVPTKHGHLVLSIPAPEGPRQLVVFTYVSGESLSASNPEHCYLAGRLLAALHAASDDFISPHARQLLDLALLIDEPVAALEPFLSSRPSDLAYLQGAASRLRNEVAAAASRGLHWGVCQGDFEAKNILITADRRATVFNFDGCGSGWRAYDLAGDSWSTSLESGSWDAFVSGYVESRPLAAADLTAVPLFRAIRHLARLGNVAQKVDQLGTRRLSNGILDDWLTVFRHWEAVSDMPATVPVPRSPRVRAAADTQSDTDIGHFPVRHSIVRSDSILQRVVDAYAIEPRSSCELIRDGLNDTYSLKARDDRYIVRVYHARRSAAEVAYELDLLNHLAVKGVRVSVPVRAADGRLALPMCGPDGTRQLVLFTYAHGAPADWTNVEHCYLSGRLLATIHAATGDLSTSHEHRTLGVGYLIDAPLAAIRPFLAERPEDWAFLETLATKLRTRLSSLDAGLDWGVCHGDFNAKNIHIASDKEATVLDFEYTGVGWRVYDFAEIRKSSSKLMKGTHQVKSTHWDAFVRGYADVRPFAPADSRALTLFQALRHLSMLGVFAQNVDRWGIPLVTGTKLDGWIKYFRKWDMQDRESQA
jgi:Ser/Thr protein kinase RdoA (MazF antagonist)